MTMETISVAMGIGAAIIIAAGSIWKSLNIDKKIEDRFDKLDGKLDRKVSELYNYVDNLGEKVADHDKECDTDRAVIKERMENFKEHKEKLLRRVEVEDDE